MQHICIPSLCLKTAKEEKRLAWFVTLQITRSMMVGFKACWLSFILLAIESSELNMPCLVQAGSKVQRTSYVSLPP